MNNFLIISTLIWLVVDGTPIPSTTTTPTTSDNTSTFNFVKKKNESLFQDFFHRSLDVKRGIETASALISVFGLTSLLILSIGCICFRVGLCTKAVAVCQRNAPNSCFISNRRSNRNNNNNNNNDCERSNNWDNQHWNALFIWSPVHGPTASSLQQAPPTYDDIRSLLFPPDYNELYPEEENITSSAATVATTISNNGPIRQSTRSYQHPRENWTRHSFKSQRWPKNHKRISTIQPPQFSLSIDELSNDEQVIIHPQYGQITERMARQLQTQSTYMSPPRRTESRQQQSTVILDVKNFNR
ncbi:hypothetical protein SNEBB_006475 [Seison nebaliae]|nr:hypothetical protein SNEBB_006475 [Seison nebaliae]